MFFLDRLNGLLHCYAIRNRRTNNKQFDDIENKYNKLKVLSASVSERPTVLSGEIAIFGELVCSWRKQLSGAQLFRDVAEPIIL